MSKNFPKEEKLKSRKTIERLFAEGESFSKFPVKLIYLKGENFDSTKAAFAVPKRNFKLAVSRNRIKRQLREAYRVHKHLLSAHKGKPFTLLFLYIGKDSSQHNKIESSMESLLIKLNEK